mmetsp:Transcript_35216/g.89138  ORF Transcript_35216/g.89138 Transcript_35216/m.89138 type:complete len:233 (-) Transcript_35216:250-948(-)
MEQAMPYTRPTLVGGMVMEGSRAASVTQPICSSASGKGIVGVGSEGTWCVVARSSASTACVMGSSPVLAISRSRVDRRASSASPWMSAATRMASDMDCPATTWSACVSAAHAMEVVPTCPRLPAYLAASTTARCAASLVSLPSLATWPQGLPSRTRPRHTSRMATSVYRPPCAPYAVPSSVASSASRRAVKSAWSYAPLPATDRSSCSTTWPVCDTSPALQPSWYLPLRGVV